MGEGNERAKLFFLHSRHLARVRVGERAGLKWARTPTDDKNIAKQQSDSNARQYKQAHRSSEEFFFLSSLSGYMQMRQEEG